MRFVDVVKASVAPAPRRRIIFSRRKFLVGFVEEFEGTTVAASAVQVWIDRRVILQIFSNIHRSTLGFVDGAVNLVERVLLFAIELVRRRWPVNMGAGGAQVTQGVQVSWMVARFVGKGECGTHRN